MTALARSFLAACAAALALAGCAPQGEFPSLAMRPAERSVSFEPPVHPPVAVPDDPALRARIAELEHQAMAGERAFAAALDEAAARVRQAGAALSDGWIAAQTALSRLEAARAPTTRALAELDQLRLDRAAIATSAADILIIETAFDRVSQLAASQQQRWERLRAALP